MAGELAALAQLGQMAWWQSDAEPLGGPGTSIPRDGGRRLERGGAAWRAWPGHWSPTWATSRRTTLAELDRIPDGSLNQTWMGLVDGIRAATLCHLGRTARGDAARRGRRSRSPGPSTSHWWRRRGTAPGGLHGRGRRRRSTAWPRLFERSAVRGRLRVRGPDRGHARHARRRRRPHRRRRPLPAPRPHPGRRPVVAPCRRQHLAGRGGAARGPRRRGGRRGRADGLPGPLRRGRRARGLGAAAGAHPLVRAGPRDAAPLGRGRPRPLLRRGPRPRPRHRRPCGRATPSPLRAAARVEPEVVRAFLPLPWATELALAQVPADDRRGWALLESSVAAGPAARAPVGRRARQPVRAAGPHRPRPTAGSAHRSARAAAPRLGRAAARRPTRRRARVAPPPGPRPAVAPRAAAPRRARASRRRPVARARRRGPGPQPPGHAHAPAPGARARAARP